MRLDYSLIMEILNTDNENYPIPVLAVQIYLTRLTQMQEENDCEWMHENRSIVF